MASASSETVMRPGRHKLPGEHIYEGMVFMGSVPVSSLEKVRTVDLNEVTMIAAYPKTGTTWLQEITWLVLHDGDTTEALQRTIRDRMPFLEFQPGANAKPDIDLIPNTPPPVIIKTHLQANYFFKQLEKDDVKVIVPSRNPKDTIVSRYHFYRMHDMMAFRGTWDEFFGIYKEKLLDWGDYFDWIETWWPLKNHPKVLFIKYEDMKKNLSKEISCIAKFLRKDLSDDTIKGITDHCTFESMRDNRMTNYTTSTFQNHKIAPFMRKGMVGDWHNYFTDEQSNYVDEQCKKVEKLGIPFEFM